MNWVYLTIAIVCEVIATSALKASEGFTRLTPLLIVIVGYAAAFYCLSMTLRSIPVGIAYAIWSGAGIVLISIIGVLFFKQSLDTPAVLGMALIISGVVVIQGFSTTTGH